MAVDVYTDNLVGMISPRLSFSRDLEDNNESTTTNNSINTYACALDSTFDFAFNVDKSVAFAPSSADDLFFNGKLIPTCLLKSQEIKVSPQKPVNHPCFDLPSKSAPEETKKSLKEFLEDSIEEDEEKNNAAAIKSFWKFRRSNSLNCDRNHKKGLIGSWKILSRSGSTGKFLEKIVEDEKPIVNFHQKLLSKFTRNNSLNNNSEILRRSHSTSDHCIAKSDSNLNSNQFRRSKSTGSALKKQQSQRQQQQNKKGKVKDNNNNNNFKGYGNHHNHNNNNSNNSNSNNSLKRSPIMLNLPSPYIFRGSVDLFSFGSLFCNSSNSKDRKKRK